MIAQKTLTVALLGNPNTGKSTLFNALTGLRQHVGNWPGKTVEKAKGTARLSDGRTVRIVDLPRTYALHAESPEERVACEFLLSGEADAVIVVTDATNLTRNLYLVLQALELTDKVIVALNFMDEAEAKGIGIDAKRLREQLGVSVVPTVAVKGEGVREVLETAVKVEGRIAIRPVKPRYGLLVENCLQKLAPYLQQVRSKPRNEGKWREDLTALRFAPSLTTNRWFALRLLEGDELALSWCIGRGGNLQAVLDECKREAEGWGTSLDLEIARALHEQTENLTRKVMTQTRLRR